MDQIGLRRKQQQIVDEPDINYHQTEVSVNSVLDIFSVATMDSNMTFVSHFLEHGFLYL